MSTHSTISTLQELVCLQAAQLEAQSQQLEAQFQQLEAQSQQLEAQSQQLETQGVTIRDQSSLISHLVRNQNVLLKANGSLQSRLTTLESQISDLLAQNQCYFDHLEGCMNALDEALQSKLKIEQQYQALKKVLQNAPFSTVESPITTSKNSDLPSSKDIRYQSKKSSHTDTTATNKRKAGGQKGHKGNHLPIPDYYDELVQVDRACNCVRCGQVLPRESFGHQQQRYVLEPIIGAYKVILLQGQVGTCKCGHQSAPAFPTYAQGPVNYGPLTQAIATYCNVHQYLPYKRTKELFADFWGMDISTGTLRNINGTMADKSQDFYEDIRTYLTYVPVVGGDETSFYLNGAKGTTWAWNTADAVYMAAELNRKAEQITKHFPTGFPLATYVSDRYSAQLAIPAAAHQACLIHIDRKIKKIIETEPKTEWASKMRTLIHDAIALGTSRK